MPEKLPKQHNPRAEDAARIVKNARRAAQHNQMVARQAAEFLEKQPKGTQDAIKKILGDLPRRGSELTHLPWTLLQ
jgi:hypothetical protein